MTRNNILSSPVADREAVPHVELGVYSEKPRARARIALRTLKYMLQRPSWIPEKEYQEAVTWLGYQALKAFREEKLSSKLSKVRTKKSDVLKTDAMSEKEQAILKLAQDMRAAFNAYCDNESGRAELYSDVVKLAFSEAAEPQLHFPKLSWTSSKTDFQGPFDFLEKQYGRQNLTWPIIHKADRHLYFALKNHIKRNGMPEGFNILDRVAVTDQRIAGADPNAVRNASNAVSAIRQRQYRERHAAARRTSIIDK